MDGIKEVRLSGCTPEPLMGYLKALGVFRLVAEQKDRDAKGCWSNGEFVLRSRLDDLQLIEFFQHEYKPTPVVVPWSGSVFFGVNGNGDKGPFSSTPTSTKIIEAFLATTTPKLRNYRETIRCAIEVLKSCGIINKDKMKGREKSRYISILRSRCCDLAVKWIDVCAVMSSEKPYFNVLLGSGGGNDGHTHFSDNFMQNLWEVLDDFDDQRSSRGYSGKEPLMNALFGTPFQGLVSNRTSALFDGGAVGGPNAGQGFERASLANPWSFILCLEGTIMLAGCISRRQAVTSGPSISFPFQARLSSTSSDSSSEKETSGREMWMPLWEVFSSKDEVEALFSEGRSAVGRRWSNYGVDFARAAASLGTDRGIAAFQRFAIVKGRIGGDNYNTSASFGRFEAQSRPGVDLLKEADRWLDSFRDAASRDNVPQRFRSALKRIESMIFDFCRYGGASRLAEILRSFGNAERELAATKGRVGQNKVAIRPLSGLSPRWLQAADDHSAEFELARSLAGIYDPEKKIEPLRANIEPVSYKRWKDKDFCDVWNSASLPGNLLTILERRMLDAGRKGCVRLPLASPFHASLGTISRYIAGDVDDRKIEELLRGMAAINYRIPIEGKGLRPRRDHPGDEPGYSAILPRQYAILKLVFLPGPLKIGGEEISIRPETAITSLLRAERTGEACLRAARRLSVSGFNPMSWRKGGGPFLEKDWSAGDVNPLRLGSALLFPVSLNGIGALRQLVLRTEKKRGAA